MEWNLLCGGVCLVDTNIAHHNLAKFTALFNGTKKLRATEANKYMKYVVSKTQGHRHPDNIYLLEYCNVLCIHKGVFSV